MIDLRPKDCPCCGSINSVKFDLMKNRGIKPFESGCCYICTECGAYTGTHKNNHDQALGVLADKETRFLRGKCHEEFDKHYLATYHRNTVYYMLAKELGIPYEECHFGYMDKEMLKKSLEIMKAWGDSVYIR